mgnify:CR=1 FL=1|jgi:hypothetical protein
MIEVSFVNRKDIVDSILDRINEGEELTSELKELLTEMSN